MIVSDAAMCVALATFDIHASNIENMPMCGVVRNLLSQKVLMIYSKWLPTCIHSPFKKTALLVYDGQVLSL